MHIMLGHLFRTVRSTRLEDRVLAGNNMLSQEYAPSEGAWQVTAYRRWS